MKRRSYTVACLAGDGVGPELMAEASRVLDEVSRLHGIRIADVHVPFGSEALTRHGHPLPPSTRAAYLEADAVLVAASGGPELDEIEAELDVRAALTRVLFAPRGDVTLISPLADDLAEWTIEAAFQIARERQARLASVYPDGAWRELVDEIADRHDGVLVEHLSVAAGLPALAFEPERFDVIVTGARLADALAGIACAIEREDRVVAAGRIAGNGPGVFAPVHAPSADDAGHGVANPSPMLLAVALLLAEGLGERSAAATLLEALTGAASSGLRTADGLRLGAAATTRQFTDAVVALLPATVTTAEFFGMGSR